MNSPKLEQKWNGRCSVDINNYIFVLCHFQAAGVLQPIDGSLLGEIERLVERGVSDAANMKVHLHSFVERCFPQQSAEYNNKRFYPDTKTICDHMYLSQTKHLRSKNDQENVQAKVTEYSIKLPNDKFHCQLRTESVDKKEELQKFLFAYQSESHRRLLQMYGDIFLLDATYKTTRYALPLFFLCVRANVNYQVVGMFVLQNETTDEICEALQLFKTWNPDWNPKYAMCDFDEKEINAVEQTFIGTKAYLCDFHREKAWTQWVNVTEHNVRENREEVLGRLRFIAKSNTIAEYKERVDLLKSSTLWRSKPKLANWFNKQWLPHHEVTFPIQYVIT